MSARLVLDCSVAAKWILPEPDRAKALSLLEAHRVGELDLIAPDILLAEFASLLAKHVRRKRLSPKQAEDGFQFMLACKPVLFSTTALIGSALQVSLAHQVSLWDSLYLALAEEYDCPVVTADRRLFRGVKPRHPSLRLLSGFGR